MSFRIFRRNTVAIYFKQIVVFVYGQYHRILIPSVCRRGLISPQCLLLSPFQRAFFHRIPPAQADFFSAAEILPSGRILSSAPRRYRCNIALFMLNLLILHRQLVFHYILDFFLYYSLQDFENLGR